MKEIIVIVLFTLCSTTYVYAGQAEKSQLEIDHKECTKIAGGKEPNIFQKLGAALNPSLQPKLESEYKAPNQEVWRLCMKERGYDL